MKKITITFILSILIISVFAQQDQFSPKFNLGVGCGLGLYGGWTNDDYEEYDSTSIDAACLIVKLHGDYAFINTLSAGFSLERNGYLTARDSSDRAYSLNAGLSVKFRFVSREFNCLYVEVLPGYSYFTYMKESSDHHLDKITSNGFNLQAGLGWDHYFGEHFGIYLSSHYTLYKYNMIINSETNEILQVNSPQEDFKITFSGMNFLKAGLLYKF